MTHLYIQRRPGVLLAALCALVLPILVAGCGGTPTLAVTPDPRLPTMEARIDAIDRRVATPDPRVPTMEMRMGAFDQRMATAESQAVAAEARASTAEALASTAVAGTGEPTSEATPLAYVPIGSIIKLTYTDTSGAPRTLFARLGMVNRAANSQPFATQKPDRMLVLATEPDPAAPAKNRPVIYYTAAVLPDANPSGGTGTWELLQTSAPINLSSDGSIADQSRVQIRSAEPALEGPLVALSVAEGDTAGTVLLHHNLLSGFWLLISEGSADAQRYRAYIVFNGGPPSEEDPLKRIVCLACYFGVCQSFC